MLLADFPSAQDSAEGRPLAGESLGAGAAHARRDRHRPRRSLSRHPRLLPCPRREARRGRTRALRIIARDHIRLARPERLLLFGDAPARALTGQPLAAARGKVHRIEGVRTVATFHPRWLLQRPSDKALAWKDLLLLMSEEG